jgi:dsDNA-binding SOS-regulon protein
MISKEELDYINTPLEDIVDAWLAHEPKILENATREELTAFLSDVKEAIKAE